MHGSQFIMGLKKFSRPILSISNMKRIKWASTITSLETTEDFKQKKNYTFGNIMHDCYFDTPVQRKKEYEDRRLEEFKRQLRRSIDKLTRMEILFGGKQNDHKQNHLCKGTRSNM